MRAVLENVQFHGHLVVSQRQRKHQAVLHRDRAIIGGVDDEAGWSIWA